MNAVMVKCTVVRPVPDSYDNCVKMNVEKWMLPLQRDSVQNIAEL